MAIESPGAGYSSAVCRCTDTITLAHHNERKVRGCSGLGEKWKPVPAPPAGKMQRKKNEKEKKKRTPTGARIHNLWDLLHALNAPFRIHNEWSTHLDHVELVLLGLGAQEDLFDDQLLAACVVLVHIPRDAVALGGQSDSCGGDIVAIILSDSYLIRALKSEGLRLDRHTQIGQRQTLEQKHRQASQTLRLFGGKYAFYASTFAPFRCL